MHLVYPKVLHSFFVFEFSWDDCNTREQLETTGYAKFGGETRCIMVYQNLLAQQNRYRRTLRQLKFTQKYDLNLNVQAKFKRNIKFVICHLFFFPGLFRLQPPIIFILLELNFLEAAFETFTEYCVGSGRLSRYSQKLSTSHSV